MKRFNVGDIVGEWVTTTTAFESLSPEVQNRGLFRVAEVMRSRNYDGFEFNSTRITNLENPNLFFFLSDNEIENYWVMYKSREQQVAERFMQ